MTDTLAAAPLTYIPFADRMIVRVLGQKTRTKGGLHVPRMALDNTPFLRAEVLFVGPGRINSRGENIPVQFQPGAIVVFFRGGQLAQQQLVIPDEEAASNDDSELMIISESHVAWEVKGLDRVSGLVGDDGKSLVLSS